MNSLYVASLGTEMASCSFQQPWLHPSGGWLVPPWNFVRLILRRMGRLMGGLCESLLCINCV